MSQHDQQAVQQATEAARQSYLAWYLKAEAERRRQEQLAAQQQRGGQDQ